MTITTAPYRKLAEIGLALPEVSPPKGAYVPAVQTGSQIFVSGQVPMIGGEVVRTGKVGGEVSLEEARQLSERCALSALAAIHAVTALDRVVRVVKIVGFVASAPGFVEQPKVIDGASDLFVAVFGEAGRHARSAIGVPELPLGAPVELEVIVEVAP